MRKKLIKKKWKGKFEEFGRITQKCGKYKYGSNRECFIRP